MEIGRKVVDYLLRLNFDDIPADVIEITRKSVLDILGVSLAASANPGLSILIEQLTEWGGKPEASVLGHGIKLPAHAAAMANGAMSRVLDFDDVIDSLGIHPSVAIFPPMMAISDAKGNVSGKEFLTAMTIGHDLCIRMAQARKHTLLESGRYDLSKVIAATAAAGKLYGLDNEQLLNALGIAYTSAIGETQCMVDGVMTVFYQQGLVASNAVRAVELSAKGFTGARNIFTGRYGYYRAFEPLSNLAEITNDLGDRFAGENLSYKPYPTCRPNISGILLALKLSETSKILLSDIREIIVRTNQQIFDLVCAPVEQKKNPVSVVDARFSLAYNIAVALTRRDVFIEDFTTDAIKSQDVIDVSRKVTTVVDTRCDDPVRLGCLGKTMMDIVMNDGSTITGEITFPKGHPKNPMSFDEVEKKFEKCIGYANISKISSNGRDVCDAIRSLESEKDVREIWRF